MSYSLRLFFRDWWMTAPIIVMAGAQIFLWWYIFVNVEPSEEQFFLHYTVTLGVDLVGEWWKLIYMPAGGALVLVVNSVVGFLLYDKDKLMSRLLSLSGAVIHILLILAVVMIVALNA